MKKSLLILLSLVLSLTLLTPFSVSAEAANKYDSLNLSPEEIETIAIRDENIQIVKKYRAHWTFVFPATTSIEEVLENREMLLPHYIIYNNNSVDSYQIIKNGKAEEIDIVTTPQLYLDLDATYIEKMNSGSSQLAEIADDIEIYNLYYFEDTSYLGQCIYYVTNKGNYVYYSSYLTDGKQLHTAEEFVNLVTRVKEERAKNPEADGGNSGSYEAETDVKTDDGITEKKSLFDNKLALYGVISAGCAVIIVIIIVAVICIKKRKKTYEHK